MRQLSTGLALVVVASASSAWAFEPEGQVLYRNQFAFTTGQDSSGASAFFSKLDGQLVVVTARHLLGPDMGIDPPIPASDLDRLLGTWIVLSPDGTPVATVDHLFAWSDATDGDRLALAVNLLLGQPAPSILPIARQRPKVGDIVYMIGCPYSEVDCMQNVYPLSYLQTHEGSLIFVGAPEGVDLAGFSGAPIVNRDGAAVGVMVASGTQSSVWATDLTNSSSGP
jgi:hypothetical protein